MARRKQAKDYDGSGFLLLPWVVMDCSAYLALSHPAVRLLNDLGRQLRKVNNGHLRAGLAEMRARGWKSNDTLTRARRELEAAHLIVETRKGRFPNVYALYGVTWRAYDYNSSIHDLPLKQFPRGAYLQKNASLTPSGGSRGQEIAPSGGVRTTPLAPSGGPIEGQNGPVLTPSGGDISRYCHLTPSNHSRITEEEVAINAA